MYYKSNITGKIYKLENNQYIDEFNQEDYKDWLLINNRPFIFEGTDEEIIESEKLLIPLTITSRQLRLGIIYSGILLSQIENTINMLEEPNKSIAFIEWEYATTFKRDNQLLNILGEMLGLSDKEIDNLFILANSL